MKQTCILIEIIRDNVTGKTNSSSMSYHEVKNRASAKKWIRNVVSQLGKDGYACDLFTYEFPSYVKPADPPHDKDKEESVMVPYYYLGDIHRKNPLKKCHFD